MHGELLGLVAAGTDPAQAKTQAQLQAADTFRKIADEYLAHAKKAQRPRSYADTERYLLKAFRPLHRVSIFHIHRRDIAACVAEIDTGRGPVAARKARAAISAMFNWAIGQGLDIPANPVLGTNQLIVPKSRERVLADAELRAIWRACGDDDYGRIVRLLMLTAQRRDEVGGMRWAEINLPGRLWVIPGERVKNHREHRVPLTNAALALIEAQPRRNDRDHVFGDGPRRQGDPHRGFSGWSKSKAALDVRITKARGGEALAPWVIHDLRRSAATAMADRLGVLPHIIEAVLNHVSGHRAGVAGIYNRALYSAEMRAALERWADHVAEISRRPLSLTLERVR